MPTEWDNYRVGLNVTVRLIDRSQRSGLAAAECACRPEYADSDVAPSHDDPLSDRAAGRKVDVKRGAEHCLKKLSTETLA